MCKIAVAPLVGAWIEILKRYRATGAGESLPLWERGLKYRGQRRYHLCLVAPLVGAWIEMSGVILSHALDTVAPLVGAWIEISSVFIYSSA